MKYLYYTAENGADGSYSAAYYDSDGYEKRYYWNGVLNCEFRFEPGEKVFEAYYDEEGNLLDSQAA